MTKNDWIIHQPQNWHNCFSLEIKREKRNKNTTAAAAAKSHKTIKKSFFLIYLNFIFKLGLLKMQLYNQDLCYSDCQAAKTTENWNNFSCSLLFPPLLLCFVEMIYFCVFKWDIIMRKEKRRISYPSCWIRFLLPSIISSRYDGGQ